MTCIRSPLLFFFLFSLLFGIKNVFGQASNNAFAYPLFDKTISPENTALYQGLVYREKYRTINNLTPYLGNSDFNVGHVLYHGQTYYVDHLKYHVYDDELLLKVRDKAGGITIQLIKDHVGKFHIINKDFVHLKRNDSLGMDASGYFELVTSTTKLTLYAKHRKKSYERKDKRVLYYEFKEGKVEFYLWYKERYNKIVSRKNLSNLFPEQKKTIDDFYKSSKQLKDTKPIQFMAALINRLSPRL